MCVFGNDLVGKAYGEVTSGFRGRGGVYVTMMA